MRIERLQRVVGPLNQIDAHAHRLLALREFEAKAQAARSRIRCYAKHVRPLNGPSILHSGNRIDEPLHLTRFIERAEENAAALDRYDKNSRWDDVFRVGVTPHDPLEIGDLTALFERCQRTDQHLYAPAQTSAPHTIMS